ncbi:hypothetical protein KY328_02735, partial [Candidatus Woesearchaeota archaeon]|nr:hypothetical protein [Candidatus Woesearchaeota archaeon]
SYGALFVGAGYELFNKYAELHSELKLKDFVFHKNGKKYFLFTRAIIPYLGEFLKFMYLLKKFYREFKRLRLKCEIVSQKKAIENSKFLYNLYMRNAGEFVKERKLNRLVKKYIEGPLYTLTFSKLSEMNAFCFLQYSLPLIIGVFLFKFKKDELIRPFKKKIIIAEVKQISCKEGIYKVKTCDKTFYCKNLVLATEITWSKRFAGVKKINKPISTHMFHIRGMPKEIIAQGKDEFFDPNNKMQSVAKIEDGSYIFYYKTGNPPLDKYFKKYNIIYHKHWNPAGTINGHTLIESDRGKNMYLIGDFNIAGLEDSFITGIYAANQIIKNKN